MTASPLLSVHLHPVLEEREAVLTECARAACKEGREVIGADPKGVQFYSIHALLHIERVSLSLSLAQA